LENYSNIKGNGNESSGSRVFPYGRIHRHDEANSEFSNALKKYFAHKTCISLFTKLRRKAGVIIYYKYTRNKIQKKLRR